MRSTLSWARWSKCIGAIASTFMTLALAGMASGEPPRLIGPPQKGREDKASESTVRASYSLPLPTLPRETPHAEGQVAAAKGDDAKKVGEPLPGPKASKASAAPPITQEYGGGSRVFPEGGFPDGLFALEGGIPAEPRKPQVEYTGVVIQPTTSDYAPPGYEARGVQEAPGVPEYLSLTAPLPAYYYQQAYYDSPGVGARPIADYAPPGFEAREFQDAPGAPEFSPITPPVPVTPEERRKFVTRGIFPGSFLVPGTNTSFRIRGFVRLTGLYDLDPIGSRDDFVTNRIPVPQQSGQNFNVAARYSRFAIETWTPTPIHEWNVHTFIEGDFFNGPDQAVGGGGNPFRLRFAFADFGYFRVGQQNSVFMDSNAFPMTVDFAGPRGLLNQRRPGARMTLPVTGMLFWAVGVEQPFSDIRTFDLGERVQDLPDVASHLRYETDFGHLQVSGIARSIGYRPTNEDVTRRGGWGLSASTVFHPWALLIGSNPLRKANPTGLERSRILLQYSFGWGIARYVQDTAGLGLDGEVDPATGGFDTLYVAGFSTSYEHWFTEKWLSNVTYSACFTGHNGGQPEETYNGAKYLAVSLWHVPIRNMSIGIEGLWGERENLNGERADAKRINALFQYNF